MQTPLCAHCERVSNAAPFATMRVCWPTLKLRMSFVSTRDPAKRPHTFRECLFRGLADDNGMFVPSHIPTIAADTLAAWRDLAYPDLAVEVLATFISPEEIPKPDLAAIISKSFA